MKITVNGENKEVAPDTTIRRIVAEFKFTPEKVAIELNRTLVKPDRYDASLKDGDILEIVTFVGGG